MPTLSITTSETNQLPIERMDKGFTTSDVRLNTTRNEYKLRANRNETVSCKRGTKLFFPANSFVDAKGIPVDGNVRLVVEECYDLDEMLAAKLSTTSGVNRLETAGMIRVKAYSKKNEVFLRAGARYNIYFPIGENRSDDFELFYGKRMNGDIIDWQLETNSAPIAETKEQSRPLSDDCFVQIVASQLRCGTHIQEMDYFNWPLSNGQNLNQWFVANFNPTPEMVDDFCANKMISQITFHIDSDGTFRDYYISHTARESYDRSIATTLATMPPLDRKRFMPRYSDDHACVLTFGRQQGNSADVFINRFSNRYDYADTTRKMSGVNTNDLNYYVFSSTELGWINCDRFLMDQGPLVDLVVESNLSDAASVSMVFDKDRSIISAIRNGGRFEFKGIPANRDVRILAIDNSDGNPTMQESRVNTSCKRHVIASAQPITLAQLNNALCWK